MKKLLLSCLFTSSILFAAPMVMANNSFSATQIAQIQLDSLSFKDLMRQFYNGQMQRAYLDDTELSQLPHVGLNSPSENETTTVALMHPVLNYKNHANEPRYLIMIEKIQAYDDGSVVGCHACAATADLFSFKKLQNGRYQLVSRTAKDAEFSASWGRVGLDLQEIGNHMQALGKHLVGSIFQNGYSSTGATELWWETLHLPEHDFIQAYGIADAGADNSGNYEPDSPLYYSYDSTFKVLQDGSAYFPIKISYSGEKPSEDYESIHKVNDTKIFKFDTIKKEYK